MKKIVLILGLLMLYIVLGIAIMAVWLGLYFNGFGGPSGMADLSHPTFVTSAILIPVLITIIVYLHRVLIKSKRIK